MNLLFSLKNIKDNLYKYLIFFISLILLALFFLVSLIYPGSLLILAIFYICFLALLVISTFSYISYLFAALSLFFTLAFPIKFGLIFLGGFKFPEPVGNFSYSTDSLDRLLLTSSIGILGLIFSKLFFLKKNNLEKKIKIYINCKSNNKIILELILFIVSICIFCLLNLKLHIFQVGILSKTILPYKLNIFFFLGFNTLIPIWLCSILNRLNANFVYTVIFICFISLIMSITLLSRGLFITLGFPLLIAIIYSSNINFLNWKSIFIAVLIFLFSLIASLLSVSYLRSELYLGSSEFLSSASAINQEKIYTMSSPEVYSSSSSPVLEYKHGDVILKGNPSEYIRQINSLFIDRWVGLEGVATAIDLPSKGIPLFKSAIVETSNSGSYGLYQKLAHSPFTLDDFAYKYGFSFGVSPGFIGFFALSGSLEIIFIATFLLGLAMINLEKILFSGHIKNIFLRVWFSVSIANSIIQFTQPIAWVKWFLLLVFCILFFIIISRFFNGLLLKKSYSGSYKKNVS